VKGFPVAIASVGVFLAPLVLLKPAPLDIHNYRNWTLANRVPVKMSMAVAQLCARSSKKQMASTDPASPHKDFFLRVFVNGTGRSQFLHKTNPNLPAGTVIVKEKLAAGDSAQPDLLTVMRKREPGYDARHHDWEYSVVDKHGKVIEQGALPRCISCHEGQSQSDFLYRSYMTVR